MKERLSCVHLYVCAHAFAHVYFVCALSLVYMGALACKYVCMYVCMFHVCVYVCMYVCMYECMYVCRLYNICICMHVEYVCMYVCDVCIYVCM